MLFLFVFMAAIFAAVVIFCRPTLRKISRALAIGFPQAAAVAWQVIVELWRYVQPRLQSRTVVGSWIVQAGIFFGAPAGTFDLESWTTRVWLIANVFGFVLQTVGRDRFGYNQPELNPTIHAPNALAREDWQRRSRPSTYGEEERTF